MTGLARVHNDMDQQNEVVDANSVQRTEHLTPRTCLLHCSLLEAFQHCLLLLEVGDASLCQRVFVHSLQGQMPLPQ